MIQALRPRLPSFLAKRTGFDALRRDQRGVTAIEFAMVMGPFLVLLFAIMEVALVYFTEFSLDNAVQKAARQIRTGQAQKANLTKDQFKSVICRNVVAFVGCDSNLKVDVRSFPNFGSISTPDAMDGNGNFNAGFDQYSSGNGGDVVLVTAYFKWHLLTSFKNMPLGLGNLPDGSRLIIAATAFRNEPFNN